MLGGVFICSVPYVTWEYELVLPAREEGKILELAISRLILLFISPSLSPSGSFLLIEFPIPVLSSLVFIGLGTFLTMFFPESPLSLSFLGRLQEQTVRRTDGAGDSYWESVR